MAAGDSSRGAQIRAADVDRDHVAGLLGTAYSEGRLSKDEYDTRLAAAFSARTYGELDQLVADLPVQVTRAELAERSAVIAPADRTNGLALASVLFGLAQFLIGPFATIPTIVLGHMARNQIKRTGEQGAGLAAVGLVLGWGGLILGILLVAATVIAASRTGAPVPQVP
jgi:Domain of unknown function (DUF1707)/Domain of unknown function (DUF4190)